MKEIWKPIEKFEGLYEVSNTGKVRRVLNSFRNSNLQNPRTLTPFMTTALSVNLYDRLHVKHTVSISRLVAKAFLSNPKNYKYVLHKDNNLRNNFVENLQWSKSSYKGSIHGIHKPCKIKCIQSGQVLNSMSECEKVLGLPQHSVYQYFKLNRKHIRNYTFEKV